MAVLACVSPAVLLRMTYITRNLAFCARGFCNAAVGGVNVGDCEAVLVVVLTVTANDIVMVVTNIVMVVTSKAGGGCRNCICRCSMPVLEHELLVRRFHTLANQHKHNEHYRTTRTVPEVR